MKIILFAILSLLAGATLIGQPYQMTNFAVTISGTSNLHDWTSNVTKVYTDASISWENGKFTAIPVLKLRIPVAGILSTKGRIMDNKTWDALQKDQYPNIRFQLQKATVSPTSSGYNVAATGSLTVAGKTQNISLSATAKSITNGGLAFAGAYTLKMSDYGIDAPTAIMGTLTTGDEVTIAYSITLAPSSSPTTSSEN
jgi:polyisoprenoid-binding protein YceI